MSHYPQSASGLNYISYPAGPTPVGLTLTANASANTKGSYSEFVSSTPFAANQMYLFVWNTDNAVRQFLFDIATGGVGAETDILPNLSADGTSTTSSIYGFGLYGPFPVAIPAGTRISGRCQCSTGSETMNVQIVLVAAGDTPGVSSAVNYGAETANSGGTQLDPGGSANTKGAYTELTSSTSAVAQWVMLIFTIGHSSVSSVFWLVDLATGAGGAETPLIIDIPVASVANAGAQPSMQPRTYAFLTYIPASTRLAARCSCSTATATVRLLDVVVLAATAPAESAAGYPIEISTPAIFMPRQVAGY